MKFGEDLVEMSTIIANLLTLDEQAQLHMALQDRENHLKELMHGDPVHIGELLQKTKDLHYRLFTCTCNQSTIESLEVT